MNKLIIAGCLIGLCAVPSHAWEFKNNPDRRPSWAIGYQQGKVSGTASRTESVNFFGFALKDDYDTPTIIKTINFRPSVRLPVSDDVTIDLECNYTLQSFDSSNGFTVYKGDLTGSSWGGTFRKYF